MKKIAFLEYAFLFEPDTTWGNIYDFESDLGKVFASLGYEAEIIDAIRGYSGRRIIYIKKMTDMLSDPSIAGDTVATPSKGKKVKL